MEEKLPVTPQATPEGAVTQTDTNKVQPPKKKLWPLFSGIILILVGIGFAASFFLSSKTTQVPDVTKTDLHTYFTYTNEELQPLTKLKKSDHKTTIEDINHQEREAYAIVAKTKTGDPRLYSYLAAARRDALLITRSMYNDFYGATSTVSHKILCEFYPKDCESHEGAEHTDSDEFSEKLAEVILQKVKQRIAEDAATTKNYTLKNDPKYWFAAPQIGLDMGSYKPWLIEKGNQFRVPENPEFAVQNFQKQLPIVKTALANITSDQRKAVIFWAGGPGTKTPPGIWLDVAGEYMIQKNISVEKYLHTQALLSMAMTDSLIGCFDSKYTYQVKRPYMVDPTIKTVMPTPNHPSYPAGHACVSNAAATVLEKELPENTSEWQRMAEEASNSRVWGGIHFPADNEQGSRLGKQVGEYASTRFSQL